jgi:hypothetical protein
MMGKSFQIFTSSAGHDFDHVTRSFLMYSLIVEGAIVKRDKPDNDVIDDEVEIMNEMPVMRAAHVIRPCFFPARVRASMQFNQMPSVTSPAYDR